MVTFVCLHRLSRLYLFLSRSVSHSGQRVVDKFSWDGLALDKKHLIKFTFCGNLKPAVRKTLK